MLLLLCATRDLWVRPVRLGFGFGFGFGFVLGIGCGRAGGAVCSAAGVEVVLMLSMALIVSCSCAVRVVQKEVGGCPLKGARFMPLLRRLTTRVAAVCGLLPCPRTDLFSLRLRPSCALLLLALRCCPHCLYLPPGGVGIGETARAGHGYPQRRGEVRWDLQGGPLPRRG